MKGFVRRARGFLSVSVFAFPLAVATVSGCPMQPDSAVVGEAVGLPFGRGADDVPADAALRTIGGQTAQPGDYQLFDLGPTAVGDRWVISPASMPSPTSFYVIALFDADLNLLMRSSTSGNRSVSHVVRHETPQLRLGVAFHSGPAGEFRFRVRQLEATEVPSPHPQLVWLDFGVGEDVRVGEDPAVSFEPFDAAVLGNRYTGQTPVVKSAIVRTLVACYAEYNVEVKTSDETSAPSAPHSTIHFGGSHPTRLGSADGVDRYNENPSDHAIIYVNNFARYADMELDPNDVGKMVGNVTAHECGHLLGLYHTQDHEHVMNDPVENAWHLVADKCLLAAPLQPGVFPIGTENAPLILAETVGRRGD